MSAPRVAVERSIWVRLNIQAVCMLQTNSLYLSSPIGRDRTMTLTAAPSTDVPTHAAMAALFDGYGAAWASRDPDAIAAFHADDGVFPPPAGAEPVRGRAAIREAFAGFLTQWPDLAFEEQSAEVAEWGWAVRWNMTGTLAGPLEVDGAEARRGSRMSVDAIDMIEVADG